MQENCGLRNFRLFKVFLRTIKHDIGNSKTQNIVCFFEQSFCFFIKVVQVLPHSNELRSLSRENVSCFHKDLFSTIKRLLCLSCIQDILGKYNNIDEMLFLRNEA